MSRILVVEDEAHLAEGLRFNLEAEGHSVVIAGKGEEALRLLLKESNDFEALVLDVMLPGKDGFTVARELRDDYLAKPFNLAILLARLESLLRRKNWIRSSNSATPAPASSSEPPEIFRFDDKLFDFQRLQLHSGGQVFQLTLMESELLRYLIRNSGLPVSRKAILQDVWNLHEDTDTRAIDNFIVRLRRYIEREPSKPRYLLTVRGLGYQFVSNPQG